MEGGRDGFLLVRIGERARRSSVVSIQTSNGRGEGRGRDRVDSPGVLLLSPLAPFRSLTIGPRRIDEMPVIPWGRLHSPHLCFKLCL